MYSILFAALIGLADVCKPAHTNYASATYDYSKTLYAAGHEPVVLMRTDDRAAIARTLGKIDMLLLCGGEDVETARYGEVRAESRLPNLTRDAWEWALLDEAVKRNLPVVGICRGEQVINVYFGGSLHQDLYTDLPKSIVHGEKKKYVKHGVTFEPDSRFGKILGEREHVFASWHHQGVKRLAPGFRIAARAPDGFVEAIEAIDRPVAGVQFHPELNYVREGDERVLEVFKRIFEWAGADKEKGK